MAQYILRDLPQDLWDRFRSRATAEGWPLRPLFLQLLDDYATRRIHTSRAAPQQSQEFAWLRPYYRRLKKAPTFPVGPDERWRSLVFDVLMDDRRRAQKLDAIAPDAQRRILNWLDDTTELEVKEPNRLSMHAIAHVGEGPDLSINRRAYQYEVSGLPPGQQAWIAEFHKRWRILRYINGADSEWEGTYESAREALGALEQDVDAGR